VKRKVLRWRLKISNDGEYLIGRGISFHIWGEAEEKARRPNSVLVLGTSRRSLTRGTEDMARLVI